MAMTRQVAKGFACSMIFYCCPLLAQEDVDSSQSPSAQEPAEYASSVSGDEPVRQYEPASSARPGVTMFKKGVEAFKKKQYTFAREMYEVSASWAYKPAQYNLAVMYARGEGVPVDLPRAMAWMVLAAERGDKSYIVARSAINDALDAEQVAQANAIVRELMPKYADETALRKAKRRWKDVKLEATGSRLGATGGLKVGLPGGSVAGLQAGSNELKDGSTMSSTAWDLTGGKQIDGSKAYRQFRETDNPYETRHQVATGTATVGPISEASGEETAVQAVQEAAKKE